ncbi:kinesin-like protein KIF17 [Hydractinia symbiolongicarpus]|uniref:kinesin-like protein KIF17 n=1 Tax=Hydractinia symbiolongicarpus TaxID=13093 RepID=UPI002550BB1F|nr:kinesin-like protein KIF17 [Hydractinia symbiolongicarpus]XP_057297982.1 kinesin-like protein KIF17 [Hydractinia symbiolongicarpus]
MSECVKVIVRCRPLNDRELDSNMDILVSVDPIEQQIILRQANVIDNCPRKVFTFDRIFDTDSTNQEIYTDVVSPLVDSVLLGYNGCVFAYGQTSCGKTFSMQGVSNPPAQQGIMSRAFEQIFENIQTTDVTYYIVRTSYLEIYNEEIRDLLHKHNKNKLEIKEHPEKGVYVKDLTTVDVTCVEDMEEVLEVGSWNRALGATAQNPDSSRSHCIFTVEFELCFTSEHDRKEHYRSGRLNLVDLAGSERQRYSKAVGERFKEATKINLSLSALGNVISALVNEKSKHIPYRASKLTRLLQDSLGGNSRTLMIACVSPGENNYGETLSTLRYANRAKNIKNRPRMNEDPKDALIGQYQREIKMLRQLLSAQMKMTGEMPLLPLPSSLNDLEDDGRPVPVRSAVVISKHERLAYEQTIANLRQKYDVEHVSREKLENNLKSVKIDYNNYRLKHEYKIHKLQIDHKQKLSGLQELLNIKDDNDSEESAYVSANSDTENTSCGSFSDKQDKSTLLSPMEENAHLWSYQWLKCYCDTYKKTMTRNMFSLNQEFNNDFYCICTEQIKNNCLNEKGSQTCQICIKRAKMIMEEELDEPVILSQPGVTKTVKPDSGEMEKTNKFFSALCCFIPSISFFGERKAVQ